MFFFFFFEYKSDQPAQMFDSSAFAGRSDRRENQSAVRLFCLTSCSDLTETIKNSTGHMTETTRSANRGPEANWQLKRRLTQRHGGEGLITGNRAAVAYRQSHCRCLPPRARMRPLQQVIYHVGDHTDGRRDGDLRARRGETGRLEASPHCVRWPWWDQAESHLQTRHPLDWRFDGPHKYPAWLWPGGKQTFVLHAKSDVNRFWAFSLTDVVLTA